MRGVAQEGRATLCVVATSLEIPLPCLYGILLWSGKGAVTVAPWGCLVVSSAVPFPGCPLGRRCFVPSDLLSSHATHCRVTFLVDLRDEEHAGHVPCEAGGAASHEQLRGRRTFWRLELTP